MKSSVTRSLIIAAVACLVATTAQSADETIRWWDYSQGMTLSRDLGKKAIVYFYTSWCPSCKKMAAETFPDPEVIRVINESFVAIRIDADVHQDIAGAYGVTGVPELWIVGQDAAPIGNVTGFIPAKRLLKILDYQRR